MELRKTNKTITDMNEHEAYISQMMGQLEKFKDNEAVVNYT